LIAGLGGDYEKPFCRSDTVVLIELCIRRLYEPKRKWDGKPTNKHELVLGRPWHWKKNLHQVEEIFQQCVDGRLFFGLRRTQMLL